MLDILEEAELTNLSSWGWYFLANSMRLTLATVLSITKSSGLSMLRSTLAPAARWRIT